MFVDKILVSSHAAPLLTGLYCRLRARKVVGAATAAPKLSLAPMNKSCSEDDGSEGSDLHSVSARQNSISKNLLEMQFYTQTLHKLIKEQAIGKVI